MIYDMGGNRADKYNLDGLDEVVAAAVDALRLERHRFDSIVATGMSGVVVASPVSLQLGAPLVIVRKEKDDSHHGSGGPLINAQMLGRRTLWLDDFVSVGKTRAYVTQRVGAVGADVIGQYLYSAEFDEPTWAARARLTFGAESNPVPVERKSPSLSQAGYQYLDAIPF